MSHFAEEHNKTRVSPCQTIHVKIAQINGSAWPPSMYCPISFRIRNDDSLRNRRRSDPVGAIGYACSAASLPHEPSACPIGAIWSQPRGPARVRFGRRADDRAASAVRSQFIDGEAARPASKARIGPSMMTRLVRSLPVFRHTDRERRRDGDGGARRPAWSSREMSPSRPPSHFAHDCGLIAARSAQVDRPSRAC